MIAIERLADVFVDVADTLVTDFDLIDFLHTVAGHAAEITGTAAVGLMLADSNGRLHYMAASSESARLLELLQLQNSEGPCLECFNSGEPVAQPDLRAAYDRWPVFARRAVASGVLAVHALPMRLRDTVIGALNVFQSESVALPAEDQRVLRALADLATIAIIQERAMARAELLNEQLQSALTSRIVIEQAKGAIAQTYGVSVERAFEMLRGHARSHQLRLSELAHTIVTQPGAAAILRDPGAPRS
ncbi:MAG: GAF and ANTAR domain-containing protein [Nocardioides sp.]